MAEQVVVSVGANDVSRHVTADKPGSASVTPTEVNVTLPVLRTTNEYVTV